MFRPVERSPAQTPHLGKFVSIRPVVRVHDGALAEKYAVLSRTLVVEEVCVAQYGPVDTSSESAFSIAAHTMEEHRYSLLK